MTMKKRLLISNVLMVAIPVAVTLLLLMFGMSTIGNRYWASMDAMYGDDNGLATVDNLMYAYADEFQTAVKNNMTPGQTKNQIKHAEKEFSDLGYTIELQSGGKTYYSSLTKYDKKIMRELVGGSEAALDSFSIQRGTKSVQKETVHEEGEPTFVVFAVHDGTSGVNHTSESFMDRYVVPFLFLALVIILLSIVVSDYVLTRWVNRNIMYPLRELRKNAEEVREGNFDEPILYSRDDEFGEVCRAFEDMKHHLKMSMNEHKNYEEYRRALISGISHDLRTPLTTIKGYVEGLTDGMADTEEKRRQYLEAIQLRTNDLERLVNDLSIYNKMENKSFRYDFEEIELNEFIGHYLKYHMSSKTEEKALVLFEACSGDVVIRGDRSQLQRVLDNIISNSIKYKQKERATVLIKTAVENDEAVWTVTDDGPGVPDYALELIFESFTRLDEARTKTGEGSGLGLAIVRTIIEDHGGYAYAENREGLAIVMEVPLDKKESADS
ncbi:MAG: HAMP domain-containing histidine kinase [Eubacteriaceae bacterium]|jgi:signal transduction histidine kinase|nr:HAMP domain-containing histidine kinase [Eubacteriaceae bacterium]